MRILGVLGRVRGDVVGGHLRGQINLELGENATGASLHRELVACDWNGDENEIPCNWNTQTYASLGHLFGAPWIF